MLSTNYIVIFSVAHVLFASEAFRFSVLAISLCGFFVFWAKKLWFFDFRVHWGSQTFPCFSTWFSVFVKNISGFSDLVSDVLCRFVTVSWDRGTKHNCGEMGTSSFHDVFVRSTCMTLSLRFQELDTGSKFNIECKIKYKSARHIFLQT